jgi:ZIP family zinc transporter
MISVVCFDLLPEAFEIYSLTVGIIGIIIGVGLISMIDAFLPETNTAHGGATRGNGYIRAGILLGIGIAIHNFPEGLAIGSALVAERGLGLSLAAVIAFHNLPEGISMAVPMMAGGYPRIRIFLATVMAGIPMGFGAIAGFLLGEISPMFISLCLAFAGGTMLFITCGELIPKSQKIHSGRASAFGAIIGVIAGIVLCFSL